jgi:hypothetical protein
VADWLVAVYLVEEPGQVCAGVLPVERLGGLVVAVRGGELRAGQVVEAGEVVG